jgi:predicted NUDIX family NTP pyrophosphohydrolase
MSTRKRKSAGLLLYKRGAGDTLEVLLAHPGGPLFARKDAGAWTIPKGEIDDEEEPFACALREFAEETGVTPAAGAYLDLGSIQQRGGKHVQAWAFEGDWAGGPPHSNHFELEWPPRSGRIQTFPEIDRLELFTLEAARSKLNPAQVEFLDRLCTLLTQSGFVT